MAFAAYALTSATVLLVVLVVWQVVAARTGADQADRRAARRSALTFGACAVAAGVAAVLTRTLA